MLIEIRRAIAFTLVTMALFGGVYPAALWAIGRLAFPAQAEGGVVRRPDGTVAGAVLVAQAFTRPEYFHPRPSAVDYDAAAMGGSNAGPTNPVYLAEVRARLAAVSVLDGVEAGDIPAEMVTASGSGLDPHISPRAAELQTARVARARGAGAERVRELVRLHTEPPFLGFLGRPRINVLALNLALDAGLGAAASDGRLAVAPLSPWTEHAGTRRVPDRGAR